MESSVIQAIVTERDENLKQNGLFAGLPCGRLTLKLATTELERKMVFKLRYDVFNKDLGDGIPENEKIGLDIDQYDRFCDHLMILDGDTVVGTFRLLQGVRKPTTGFYSETEFNLSNLGLPVEQVVELGRGCISQDYRKQSTLMTLFWGLHQYMLTTNTRYLMGMGSLPPVTTVNDAELSYQILVNRGIADTSGKVFPLDSHSFKGDSEQGHDALPPLLQMYIEFGAKILGRPAYDPIFRCFDMFVFFDMDHLSTWGQEILERFDKRLSSGDKSED